jgi:hypothetical protein
VEIGKALNTKSIYARESCWYIIIGFKYVLKEYYASPQHKMTNNIVLKKNSYACILKAQILTLTELSTHQFVLIKAG